MAESSPGAPGYTFRDSDIAGDRLALVAEVFNPASASLLTAAVDGPVRLAVDLGCGPGHTTRLGATTTGAARTVGLDASAAFIDRARQEASPGTEFLVHDVTTTPFPVGPADLIFARYLVAHLADPMRLVASWGGQLRVGGRLVLEEVEHIETDDETFARYLEIVAGLIEHRGGNLYVGRAMRDATAPRGLAIALSQTAEIAPSTSAVARIFAMNLQTWRTDPWVTANIEADALDTLRREIDERQSRDECGLITWTHRQMVFERER